MMAEERMVEEMAAGLGFRAAARLKDLSLPPPDAPAPPKGGKRYERKRPGEIVHLDMKTVPRFKQVGHRKTGRANKKTHNWREEKLGCETIIAAVDDCSRMAHSQIYPDSTRASALAHLYAMLAFFRKIGVKVKGVMTDNGAAYRSAAFRDALRTLGIRHYRIPPYTPRINGKVERFIQTMKREWLYGLTYADSIVRATFLPKWELYYNAQRLHSAIERTPLSKLAQLTQMSSGLHT